MGSSQEVIPESDGDIDRIIGNLEKIGEMTAKCSLTRGAEIDCALVQKYFLQVRDARHYLQHADYWLRHAATLKNNNFLSGLDEEDAARFKAILDMENTVLDGENYAASLEMARENLAAFKDCHENLDKMSLLEFHQLLNRAVASLNELKSAEETFGENIVAEKIPGLDNGFSQGEFTELVSAFGDAKTQSYNDHRDGKKWRKPLASDENRKLVGDATDRLLAVYTQTAAESRQAAIEELAKNTTGLDDDQKLAYSEVQRINARSAKAKKAFDLVEFLIKFNSRTGSGTLTNCYLKLNEQCGVMDLNFTSRLALPENVVVKDFKVAEDLKGDDNSWEKPVEYLNGKLAEVEGMLTGIPELGYLESVASLSSDTATVKPREKFKVKFTAMFFYPAKSWIGFVPSDVAHGYEGTNLANAKGKRKLLLRRESGEIEFKAPKKPGKYDLRMNDISSGREVASLSIEVVDE